MPIDHYIDDDYSYIIYRYHRIIPSTLIAYFPKVKWGAIIRPFRWLWDGLVQTFTSIIT